MKQGTAAHLLVKAGRALRELSLALKAEDQTPFWKALVGIAEPMAEEICLTTGSILGMAAKTRIQTEFSVTPDLWDKVMDQNPSGREARLLWFAYMVMAPEWQIRKTLLSLMPARRGYRVYAVRPSTSVHSMTKIVGATAIYSCDRLNSLNEKIYAWYFVNAEEASNAEMRLRAAGYEAEAAPLMVDLPEDQNYDQSSLELDMRKWTVKF